MRSQEAVLIKCGGKACIQPAVIFSYKSTLVKQQLLLLASFFIPVASVHLIC